jgi:hypothetical protein
MFAGLIYVGNMTDGMIWFFVERYSFPAICPCPNTYYLLLYLLDYFNI